MTIHLIMSKSSLCWQRSSNQRKNIWVSWSIWYWDLYCYQYIHWTPWIEGEVSVEEDCLPLMPSGPIRLLFVEFEDPKDSLLCFLSISLKNMEAHW